MRSNYQKERKEKKEKTFWKLGQRVRVTSKCAKYGGGAEKGTQSACCPRAASFIYKYRNLCHTFVSGLLKCSPTSTHTHTEAERLKKTHEGLLFSLPLRSTSEYSVTNTEGDRVTAQMKNKFLLSPCVSCARYYHTDRSLTFLPCHSGS